MKALLKIIQLRQKDPESNGKILHQRLSQFVKIKTWELGPILELVPPSNLAKKISARALFPVNTVFEFSRQNSQLCPCRA